jgi:hypothetical protein
MGRNEETEHTHQRNSPQITLLAHVESDACNDTRDTQIPLHHRERTVVLRFAGHVRVGQFEHDAPAQMSN